jgi:mannose-1-phosphate guanylyltransferase
MDTGPLIAVILAGGSGKRFWPLSTAHEPKQFLRILGDRSMLQDTWDRLDGLVPPRQRLVVTGAALADRVRAELPELAERNLVAEPSQRDTAAAAILGTALAAERWPGAMVLTLPADHLIDPAEAFHHLIIHAVPLVRRRRCLSTIGIAPLEASSAYGYIERGEPLEIGGGLKAYRLERFTEKPDADTAAAYLERGAFYWNAGIFLWPADVLLEEAAAHLPGHARALGPAARAWGKPEWQEQLKTAYQTVERIPVDRGIMERTSRAAVVEATFRWSDLGGWIALGRLLEADALDNRIRGPAVLHDSRGVVVYNTAEGEPVICVGLRDAVVVHTEHGVLVCPKDSVEGIKAAVDALADRDAPSRPS